MANDVCEECGTRCAVGAPRCPHCSSARLVPEGQLTALVPSLTVACSNQACPAEGVQRRVGLSQVIPGVLVLPLLVCARCGFELLKVTEDIVPKITVHGGPSDALADAESAPPTEPVEAAAEDSEESAPEEPKKAPQRRTRSK